MVLYTANALLHLFQRHALKIVIHKHVRACSSCLAVYRGYSDRVGRSVCPSEDDPGMVIVTREFMDTLTEGYECVSILG